MDTKQCYACSKRKPKRLFRPKITNKDGLYSYCIECTKHKARISYKERKRKYLCITSPKKVKICLSCNQNKETSAFPRRYATKDGIHSKCKECSKARNRELYKIHSNRPEYLAHMRYKSHKVRAKLKSEIFEVYGEVCSCCGENKHQFLCVDHINGGGNKHRKSLKRSGGSNFYSWLRKSNFPKGFRTLCYNCNMAIGIYGKCPHNN